MTTDAPSFARRLLGAAVLNAPTYEEVEADHTAWRQALAVVLLSGLAAGVGASGDSVAGTMAAKALIAVVTWAVWAALVAQLGGGWFAVPATRVDWGELLRTLGFAATPGLLQLVGVFGGRWHYAAPVSWLWMLAAMVVAVRQALDYAQTWRAVVVCLVAGAVAALVSVGLGLAFSTPVF